MKMPTTTMAMSTRTASQSCRRMLAKTRRTIILGLCGRDVEVTDRSPAKLKRGLSGRLRLRMGAHAK
jgi:hypothetical protein